MSGPLFVIGGHEDREGDRLILKAVADARERGPVALVTAPSRKPERYLPMYVDAFRPLGVEVIEVRLEDRAAADDPGRLGVLDDAGVIFISGGNQVRGSETLRGSRAAGRIRERWRSGIPVAGTSAGASLIAESMLGGGSNAESPDPVELEIVHGLALLRGVLVDQHFAERGRLPRMLAASALCRMVGLGVDEDTAAVVRDDMVEVIGAGTVTIADPARAAARRQSGGISIRGLQVDVVVPGDAPFDISAVLPTPEHADA